MHAPATAAADAANPNAATNAAASPSQALDASGTARLNTGNSMASGGNGTGQTPRGPLKGAAAAALAEAAARQRAEAGRLRLPEFEWYLGPMYKRYGDILAERARANTQQVVKKKVNYTVEPEPSWMKHTKPNHVTYSFPDAVYERPLSDQLRIHLASGTSPRSPRAAPSSARATLRLRDGAATSGAPTPPRSARTRHDDIASTAR
mmetsp:Transcript_73980/g.154210  ORF Transcript_73980/g.154210 Transcript_73980/m.154210 type:complete len:206 (-) Transcript_73980:43-660(-)